MATEDLIASVRSRLATVDSATQDPFALVADLARLVNARGSDPRVHELVVRACQWREAFGTAKAVFDAVVRQRGLFPYLRPESLDFSDAVAYEAHRPDGLRDSTVFHRVQAEVYFRLMLGHNVVLSAPTSFGKSLIIDAVIASNRYSNIVVVVPTIALIDETRRRLFTRFGNDFRFITRVGQRRGTRNIFVLTQERVVEFTDWSEIDFFAIDEFYKLDPKYDEERSSTLNEALYRLSDSRAQFFLLGPNITGIPEAFSTRFPSSFIWTDYATVASETHLYPTAIEYRIEKLLELLKTSIRGPTIIYCRSPDSARHVAASLVEAGVGTRKEELEPAARWASEHYHPDWLFGRALRNGIGIHHGKIPRALTQFVVRAFDRGLINLLVCTSTLIEGVNTKARNVVVYDNQIAQRNLEFFDYSNIKGRSGRMREYFVGHVYLFAQAPAERETDVDVPLVTQTDAASDSLLVQLDSADLSPAARERLRPILEQRNLSIEVIRTNRGIDPSAQIRVAQRLQQNPEAVWPTLNWTTLPTSEQLYGTCEIIWEELAQVKGWSHGVSSARQLAFKLDRLRSVMDIRALVESAIGEQDDPDAGTAVEDTLDFLNYWATYHFPRYLMALSRIQAEVFSAAGLPEGDYRVFAAAVENLFVPAGIAALDEYGVPIQTGMKLQAELRSANDLDTALARLKRVRVERTNLDAFEKSLVLDAQMHI